MWYVAMGSYTREVFLWDRQRAKAVTYLNNAYQFIGEFSDKDEALMFYITKKYNVVN